MSNRQPSLFNFKQDDFVDLQLRNSGLTPSEERALIIAAITGDFPRKHYVQRTGTSYIFNGPRSVTTLLKNLHYGNKGLRDALAEA